MDRTRKLLVVLAVAVFALVVSATAFASSQDPARQSGAKPSITGTTTGKICKAGYDTEASVVTPPDDSTGDNPAAGIVTLTKSCKGAVVASLDTEVGTATNGFIHMDMRATCTGTGGFTTHCTVGSQVFGNPGHTFVETNGSQQIATHPVTEVFAGLLPGQWKVEALPGGDGASFVDYRTFVVQAYSGG